MAQLPAPTRRLRSKQPGPAPAPEIKVRGNEQSYYTKVIENYWRERGPSLAETLRMRWFESQPTTHKHLMDLAESGLLFQVKMKMIWLVDIPGKDEYNKLVAINMVPFRMLPGVCCRDMPSSLAGISAALRGNIRSKVEHYTQLEASGWVFKELRVLEILAKPEGELVVPWAGKVIALGNKYLKLPASLAAKKCLINIQNTDNACFQYVMVCWKLGYHKALEDGGIANPERWPRFYVEGDMPRGRPSANRVLEYKTAGMDFSMFSFEDHAPTDEELQKFEANEDVSIFVYDWATRSCGESTVELLRLLRSPAKLYSQEVHLLNYRSGDDSHLVLCTDFQRLASRQRMEHKFFGDVHRNRTCPRCMRRFKDNESLQQHLDEAACLEPTSSLEPPTKTSLPLCDGDGNPARLTFTAVKKKLRLPVCVYMDYEMFWDSVDTVQQQGNRAYTSVVGRNVRVASYAYYTSAVEGFSIPAGHQLKLYRGDDAEVNSVLSLLELAQAYLDKVVNHPSPLRMSVEDEERFQDADCCHLCDRIFADGVEKVRDHCHLSGRFRGAAHDACNKQAKTPKHLVVWFHNLTGYDGKVLMKTIQKLQNPCGPYHSLPAFEYETPANERHNEELAKWMKEQTNEWCHFGRHAETWHRAIREIRKAPKLTSVSDLKVRSTASGAGVHIKGVGAVVCEFLARAPPGIWTAESVAVGGGRVRKTISSLKLKVISKTSERYPMIQFGPLRFQDTANFLKDSLDNLIKSQRKARQTLQEAFPRMAALPPKAGIDLDLLLRKIPFPYKSLTDVGSFERPAQFPIEAYKNDLTGEECSTADYALVGKAVESLKLDSFGDYHDVYLHTDVLALADCFESFRETFLRENKLDVAHFVSMPSAAMQAALLKTGARPELICEENGGWELMNDFDEGILGGQSVCFQPYAQANNPMMGESFNPNIETSWITYVDANSLYPCSMTYPLPYESYERVEVQGDGIAQVLELMQGFSWEDDVGYMLVVDFDIPENLHDHLDFAPVCRMEPRIDELAPYQQRLQAFFESGSSKKVVPYLGVHHESRRHIALLKFYVEQMGCCILRVHRIWSFTQRRWLQPFMKDQTDKRAAASDEVVRNVLKLGPNSVYGMLLQNKSGYKNTNIYTDPIKWERASCNPRTKDWDIFDMSDDGFLGLVDLAKPSGSILDTPRLAGWAVLDISKLAMYDTYYRYFKAEYGDAVTPLMTDTDSMILHIRSPTWPVETMRQANSRSDCPVKFDLSKVFSNCVNKGKLGCFKVEEGSDIIHAGVFLMAKMYALKQYSPAGELHAELKGKGIPSKVLKMTKTYDDYYRMLAKPYKDWVEFRRIGCKRQRLEHYAQCKKGLGCYNDKVYQHSPWSSTAPGHWKNGRDEEQDEEAIPRV